MHLPTKLQETNVSENQIVSSFPSILHQISRMQPSYIQYKVDYPSLVQHPDEAPHHQAYHAYLVFASNVKSIPQCPSFSLTHISMSSLSSDDPWRGSDLFQSTSFRWITHEHTGDQTEKIVGKKSIAVELVLLLRHQKIKIHWNKNATGHYIK